MKYLVVGLSFVNGLWMLIDGIYVSINGKYIGPERPGPWASVVGLTGINVFKLGPMFIIFGLAWLVFAGAVWLDQSWSRGLGLALSILTLWYLPFGTLISIIVLILLLAFLKT